MNKGIVSLIGFAFVVVMAGCAAETGDDSRNDHSNLTEQPKQEQAGNVVIAEPAAGLTPAIDLSRTLGAGSNASTGEPDVGVENVGRNLAR